MVSKRALAAVAAGVIATCGAGTVSAKPGNACNTPAARSNPHCIKAPEIDAASGAQAIALLSGILLLVGERARRRRD